MQPQQNEHYILKLVIWFIFLSTLGVGGGIFFLLFAVVPVEQHFTDAGWSQFKIESVMKYFVFGWVLFGIAVSLVFFFLILKKNRWRSAAAGTAFTILLCAGGLYYFLNTGTGVVQSSQGEIVTGERFTFGPYPEKEQLKLLAEEGYDGVITLLNPALPIEKPLLDKEMASAEEAGLAVHSLPMLPWVGDNSGSIEHIKELIKQDDKKYYVHCYLGRHRVDVVKQVVNEELGEDIDVRFLQPTTLERGSLFYFPEEEILMGPYPTDEEWFTRIKRGETEHVLTLLPEDRENKWLEKEKETVRESELGLTEIPLRTPVSVQELREVVETARATGKKTYIHNFNDPVPILMLEAILSWDKTLSARDAMPLTCGDARFIGRKMMTGCMPADGDRKALAAEGIEQVKDVSGMDSRELYKTIQQANAEQTLTYWTADSVVQQERIVRMAEGLLYGSLSRGAEYTDRKLTRGAITKRERNLLVGPQLTEDEYESFALTAGVARIIHLRSASIETAADMLAVERNAKEAGIPLRTVDLTENYADHLLPLIEEEQGLTYIMTEASLIPQVNAYLKNY